MEDPDRGRVTAGAIPSSLVRSVPRAVRCAGSLERKTRSLRSNIGANAVKAACAAAEPRPCIGSSVENCCPALKLRVSPVARVLS
jgi:hypothetical protein